MRIEYNRGFCEFCAPEEECSAKGYGANDLMEAAIANEPECPYFQQLLSAHLHKLVNLKNNRTRKSTSDLDLLSQELAKTKAILKQREIDGDQFTPFSDEEIRKEVDIDSSPIHNWRGLEFINTYVNNCGLSREFWLPLHRAIALRGQYQIEILEEENEDYKNKLKNITQEAGLDTKDNIQREIIFTLVLENLENLWVQELTSQNQL